MTTLRRCWPPRIPGEWRAAGGAEPTEEVLSALYAEFKDRLDWADRRVKAAEAHAGVEGITECPTAAEHIRDTLAAGERPR